MRRYTISVSAILFFLLLSIYPDSLSAAPYYEGKVITIVVGYGPGGGYDRMARILAKHLSKHIPGKPSILISNMVGANTIIAANYVYNIAKPDGLTIGTFSSALPLFQLTKLEGVKFDILKYAWIGSMAVEGTVFVLHSDLPYKSVDDLLKAKSPIVIGAAGPTDKSGQFPAMLKEYIGLNIKLVFYTSSADIMLAVERKEVDGIAASYSSQKPFIDRGLVRPLIRGRVAVKGTEHLPVDEDLTTDKKGKAVMRMLSAADFIGRPFVCPPDTPPEQMKILSDGFAKVATDPHMLEDARMAKMEIQYTSGKEILMVINAIFSQPPDIIAEFSKHVKF